MDTRLGNIGRSLSCLPNARDYWRISQLCS